MDILERVARAMLSAEFGSYEDSPTGITPRIEKRAQAAIDALTFDDLLELLMKRGAAITIKVEES